MSESIVHDKTVDPLMSKLLLNLKEKHEKIFTNRYYSSGSFYSVDESSRKKAVDPTRALYFRAL